MNGRRKLRVLIIGTRPVIPQKDGRTYLLDQYSRIIINNLHGEVYFACFSIEKEQPSYFSKVFGIEEPNLIEKGANVLIKSFILKKWPIQTSLMYSRKANKEISEIVKMVSPNVIICDMIRTAPYVVNLGQSVKKVLDIDDLLSKRYWRQSELDNLDDTVIGQMREKIPSLILRFISKHNIMKNLLVKEAKLMERYELSETKNFDEVFFCSPQDTKEFNAKSEKKAKFVHVAVNVENFSTAWETEYDENTIGYVGNIDIAANKDSVRYLINNIMPEIRKKNDHIRLLVIGKCSEENYKELCIEDGIEFTKYVDDIKEYAKKCLAIVAPIQYGSGIKIKIIESMAMKIPVITNNLGVEGLRAENKRDIIICDNVSDYVKSVLQLNSDKTMRNMIGNNGFEYVSTFHSMERSIQDLGNVLITDYE